MKAVPMAVGAVSAGSGARVGTPIGLERVARLLLRDAPRFMLGVLLLAALAINFANIAGRYLFGSLLDWAEEVLVLLFIWAVFLGASAVSYDRSHIVVDLLLQVFPRRMRRVLDWAVALLTVAVCGFAAFQSFRVVRLMVDLGQVSMAAKVPMAVPYAAFVAGFALIALSTVASTILRPPEGAAAEPAAPPTP